MTSGYAAVADEYYDEHLHPTCANFGELSRRFIEPRILRFRHQARVILEVGAGRSIAAKSLENFRSNIELTLLDSSNEMLSASRRWATFSHFVVADAQATGLPELAFDLIISSLGDPYNTIEFWCEIDRLLRPGGICLFTTPAPEWALAFRNKNSSREAEFVLSTGERVCVPSFVPEQQEQLSLIERFGLSVQGVEEFFVSDLSGNISPKLKRNLRLENPVVLRGFEIQKGG